MIYSTGIALDERFALPLTGPANYRVQDNLLQNTNNHINPNFM